MHPLPLLLLQLACILLASRLLTRVVAWLGQPSVIAEVVAGIALGPSLLGLLWPEAMNTLFPASSLGVLNLISQLGLVFFMFLVGLEFDPKLLEGRGASAFLISNASIVVPFVMGLALALPLHESLAPASADLPSFALFMGAAMSITAFPVLARILTEKSLISTKVGAISLACAALNDVTAWCILAFVVAFASSAGLGSAAVTTLCTLVYMGVMLLVIRPLLARLGPKEGQDVSSELVAFFFLGLLVSAIITEWIGIHALFGGFLMGSVMPRDRGFTHALASKIEDFVTIVLLPLFFACSGLRTQVGLVSTWADALTCVGIITVACVGKFGGSAVAARLTGMSWRESGAIGILMNPRGLMELIVLNIGLDLGVISPRLFTMMVIMALVTTWITSPLLEWIYPREKMLAEVLTPPSAAQAAYRCMICIADPAIAPAMVRLAHNLRPDPREGLLALHLLPADRPSVYLRVQADPEDPQALDAVGSCAEELGIQVENLAFASSSPAEDICRVAEEKEVPLLLLGTHRSLLGRDLLGGIVGKVLADSPCDVGILVDRGLEKVEKVLILAENAAVRRVSESLRQRGVALSTLPPRAHLSEVGRDYDLILAPLGEILEEEPPISVLALAPQSPSNQSATLPSSTVG
ncbi:MAG TPA: cation:proton antiporter [Myxococcota bacterium]|nr:cation:proton antiporter [Myxococcota bacterium]